MIQGGIKSGQRFGETGSTGAIERMRARGCAEVDSFRAVHPANVVVAVPSSCQDTPCVGRCQYQEEPQARVLFGLIH